MNSQMQETSEERGHSVMSIITSLHKPAQLYARLNMYSYRAGLIVFILTFVLGTVSNFFSFFVFNRPFDASPDWLSELTSFMMPGIPLILGKITFFLVGSVILVLIFRYVIREQVGFCVPFTVVGISYVPYYLLGLCCYWIGLMLVYDPLDVFLYHSGFLHLHVGDFLLRFVSPIVTTLVFCWYMTSGTLAVTKIRVRYAVLIAVVIFVITWFVQNVVFLACHFWLNM